MATVLPDLSIRQLEYLVAVVDAPTFAVAAEGLDVSPSALSQGLAELERRVGVPLFDREGRRRVFREAAQPVLDHAREVVALTGDLVRWADRARTGADGLIRLGMIDAAAVNYYPDVLRRFRDEHPDLKVHLRVSPSGLLLEELVSGRVDLIVCVEPAEDVRGIEIEVLRSEQLAIYRPDGKQAGAASSWGPWVLFPDGSHTRTVIEGALRAAGAEVDVVAESHQPEVLREMVGLGFGWTVLPTVQAETGPRPLTRAKVLTERRLVAARRRGPAADPSIDALAAALRS